MTTRALILIGNGPVLAIAQDIASAGSPSLTYGTIELSPERIPEADIAALIGRPPSGVQLFAAMGLHALNHARSDLVARFKEAGYEPASLIHPSAAIAHSATIGANALVAGNASVGPNCALGEGCVILDGARIEAGAKVGAYAWIGANVVVGFGASVGDHTILRPGVHLDAGVPVGHHCELSTHGLRQAAIPDCVFETPTFATARVFGANAP